MFDIYDSTAGRNFNRKKLTKIASCGADVRATGQKGYDMAENFNNGQLKDLMLQGMKDPHGAKIIVGGTEAGVPFPNATRAPQPHITGQTASAPSSSLTQETTAEAENKSGTSKVDGRPPFFRGDSGVLNNPVTSQLNFETGQMNAVINHHQAQKNMANVGEEQRTAFRLQQMEFRLAMQQVRQLIYGPSELVDLRLPDLPEDMVAIIRHIAMQTGWPPFLVLLALLGAIAIAMRGRYRLKLDDDWSEALVLYLFIAASSGMRKSQIVSLLKKAFQDFLDKRQLEFFAASHDRINFNRVVKKMERVAVNLGAAGVMVDFGGPTKDNIDKILARAREVASQVSLLSKETETPPAPPKLFIDGVTPEKLPVEMAAQGEVLASMTAENGMLNSRLKNQATSIRILLTGYTMDPYADSTITRGDTILRHPAINITYVVQEKVLADFYADEALTSLGLGPRFLACFYNGAHWALDTNVELDGKAAMSVYHGKVTRMLERNFTQERERVIHTITVSQDAYDAVKACEGQVGAWLREGKYLHMEPFMRKLHGSTARIAGVLHAWQYDEPELHPVSLATMQTAIAITSALIPHAAYAFDTNGLRAYKDALKIIAWIWRHGKTRFNSRHIAQGIAGMKNENIFPALDLLEQHCVLAQHIDPPHPRECVLNPRFFSEYPRSLN